MVALEHAAAGPRPAARRSKARPGKGRTLSIDTMAETLAQEVIQANTDFDGRERAPMRMAGARITLGVVRAREGDRTLPCGIVHVGVCELIRKVCRGISQSQARYKSDVQPSAHCTLSLSSASLEITGVPWMAVSQRSG